MLSGGIIPISILQLDTTPYQVLYGQPPLNYLAANLGLSTTDWVQEWGRKRGKLSRDLKDNIYKAQHRMKMKQFADQHKVDREFQVGDFVYLKLQPYWQLTVTVRKNLKLSSCYFDPFEILEKIGSEAYRLRLPEGSKVHLVFHVSLLKPSPSTTPIIPLVGEEGQLLAEPEGILDLQSAI